MTTQVARTPWPVAVRAQLGLLWWSRRTMMLFAIVLGLYVMIELMITLFNSKPTEGVSPSSVIITELAGVVVMIAAGWGIAVWRGETKEQRLQMLTAPMDTSAHEFARVTGGALTLLAVIVSFIVVSLIISAVQGEMNQIAEVPWTAWLLFVMGPLLAYAFIVPVSTLTPRALEVILLAIMTFYMSVLLLGLAGYEEEMMRVLAPLSSGRLGIASAFDADRINRFGVGTWFTAYTLWLSLAAAALYAALRWRRGRA